MQINSVQQSPNFGMALRIKPEAGEYINHLKRKELETLIKVREMLKDTKYYHLEIGKNGARTIESPYASRYQGGYFKLEEPNDEFLGIITKWAGRESSNLKPGDKYKTAIKFADKEAALKAYKDITNTTNCIEEDAKIVKYFDDRAIEKVQEDEAAYAEKRVCENIRNDLLSTCMVK